MGNFLKILTSLTALALFALTISSMAVSENPPPLLLWAMEKLDLASTAFWPKWEEARRIEAPENIYSTEFLWYFLLRGPWEVWKVWLIGSAGLAVAVGLVIWVLEDFFFDEDVLNPVLITFLNLIFWKAILILGRYVWFFFQ